MNVRRKIAILMADGRERTTGEIANRIGAQPYEASSHLRFMAQMGLLSSSNIEKITLWKRAEAINADSNS